jgi:phosphatidylglycerophosphate synthase
MRKQHIPWLMAGFRAALGPILVAAQAARWDAAALASMVVAALLSDIFDGVLARRWHCDTPAVRLFDSMADTVFYLGVAFGLWIGHPQLIHSHAKLLLTVIALEAVRFVFDFIRFGKPASYHSYLAKTWGLVLAIAVVATFAGFHADALVSAALLLGIVCDCEGLAMSLILPAWQRDVKTLFAAWHVRRELRQRHLENVAAFS